MYFSQPCPIPYHIIHPQFFLFFGKKLYNALWKIAHIGRKYSLPLIQEQALYLIFYGEHSMNHFLDFENIFFTSSRIMRRAWHWFEAGYNETKQPYHSTKCISLYFLIHRKYTIWNQDDEQKHLHCQNHFHHRGHYNSADELAMSETVVGVKGAELPSKQDKSVICLLSHFSTWIFVRDK